MAKQINEKPIVIRLQIEEATAWLNSPLPEQAVNALEESEELATQIDDYVALADLEMLRSTLAIRDKDMTNAFFHANSAREFALKAVDPMVFLKLRVKREPKKSILLLIEHLKLSHLDGLLIRLWIYQIQSPLEIVDEDTTIGS